MIIEITMNFYRIYYFPLALNKNGMRFRAFTTLTPRFLGFYWTGILAVYIFFSLKYTRFHRRKVNLWFNFCFFRWLEQQYDHYYIVDFHLFIGSLILFPTSLNESQECFFHQLWHCVPIIYLILFLKNYFWASFYILKIYLYYH
jgi:hypothetical protein